MRKLILYIALFAVNLLYCNGQNTLKRSVFLPNHIKIQFAGNLGFLSLGIGYSFFHSNLLTSFYYGFVPKSVGGENINIYSFKSSYNFLNKRIKPKYKLSTYIGTSLSYSGFTPIQVFPHIGGKFTIKPINSFKGKDVFVEVGTTGLYLNYLASNKDVKLSEVINYSIGFTVFIDRFKN